jgi:hypothetical protein
MIKNANDFEQMIKEQFHSPGLLPVYPQELEYENAKAKFHGLTKREYFAGLAMQALITNVNYSLDAVANLSVEMSDKILKELDKK